MRKYLAIVLLLVCTWSCTDRDDEIIAINIRVRNISSLNFDMVQVGESDKIHENVSPDSFSDYLEYEVAYRYAFIQIQSGEETFVLQPIDFVGETALPIGLYTYELDITEEGEVLLNFLVD
ncbi:MAG: hypothetical protein ACR2MM_00945 [Flavobacteriaceae bacterium]